LDALDSAASNSTDENRPISVYRLGGMPIQSCGQRVSTPHGKAGARLNAHTELRAKRQRSAREAIYRNRSIQDIWDEAACNVCQVLLTGESVAVNKQMEGGTDAECELQAKECMLFGMASPI